MRSSREEHPELTAAVDASSGTQVGFGEDFGGQQLQQHQSR